MKKKFKIFGVGKDKDIKEIIDDDNEQYELDKIDKNVEEDMGQIALDILDNGNELIILAPVAGMELKDIDLSFFNQVLTISGIREKPNLYNSGVFIKNSECYWGRFSRKIILPENLDFENIKASMENNLLIITIPKLHFSNKNIKINKVY